MKKYLTIIFIPVILILTSCTGKPKVIDRDTLLISIGDDNMKREIGIVEVRANFFSYEGESPDTAIMRLNQVVDNLIETHILGLGAQAAGMLDDSTAVYTIEMARENSVLGELYWQVVINRAVVDSLEIVKMWEDMAQEIWCKHILLNDSTLADSVYKILAEKWETPDRDSLFNEMVQLYSQDQGTKPIGGDLDYFTKGRMVKPFEDAAFAMADGQLSEPVKTDFGWHLIYRISARENMRRRPLEESYLQLKAMKEQELQRELADNYIDSLKNAFNVQVQEPGFSVLFKKMEAGSSANPFGAPPVEFSEEEKSLLFLTYGDVEVTLGNLKAKLDERKWILPYFTQDTVMFRKNCENIVLTDMLMVAALELKIDKLPVVERNVYAQVDRTYSWQFVEDSIKKNVVVEDRDLLSYYESNPQEFTLPERRRARLIEMTTLDSLQNAVLPQLRRGDTVRFDTLAKLNSIHFSSRSGGRLGLFPRGRYPAFDSVIFSMTEIGSISDPFAVDSGHFSVVMLEEVIPETLLSFEEVKTRIDGNLRISKTDSIKLIVLEDLRAKFKIDTVSNYEMLLKQIIGE
ncbi:peptidylprolyl isomerase [candidate division WOR-3 bacterium]|nr:peptidylprolyl isomerase [candidate division WOR-3 bacterium]